MYTFRFSRGVSRLHNFAKRQNFNLSSPFNCKNAVLLTNLPENITLPVLKEKLKDLDMKDVHLQPGCSLHFTDKSQFLYMNESLKGKYYLKVGLCSNCRFLMSMLLDFWPKYHFSHLIFVES
jgi:hypothetical protein